MDTTAERSFEDWYRREHPGLVTALAVTVGDADLAADAVDEALARALERWDRLDRPTAWTYRVALNVVRRRQRRRTLERTLLGRHHRPAAPLPGPAGELWLLVADLPPRQREAVVLRHIGHLTEAEVADVMGVARGTVSATLRTAHATLRQAIDDGAGPATERTPSPEPDLDPRIGR
jgi:RNA polymerase sigma-70 factor (ECF subfamily)